MAPFPLMPGHDHINLVAELDPVAAVRDAEIGERIRRYPKLVPFGAPDFGHAVQEGTEWRIGATGACDPAGARYDLARTLRKAARDEPAPGAARLMRATADRLDPADADRPVPVDAARLDPADGDGLHRADGDRPGSPSGGDRPDPAEGDRPPADERSAVNEWEVGDRRYRVIRVERFTLIMNGVMEPPRPTDADLLAGDPLLRGHLLDPLAPAGRWETQLRLNLADFVPNPGTVPEAVMAEDRRAVRSHAGVVLLPPTFTVLEILDGTARPVTGGPDPDQARVHLAHYFGELLPELRAFRGDPATDDEIAAWKEAARQVETTTGHEFDVLGGCYRTVRVSRMVRLGPDGPEPPRASDQDRYGLPADDP